MKLLYLLLWAVAPAVQPNDVPMAQTEMLGVDVPDEFQVGNHRRNDQAEIMELVQPPETVDNWSKLITSLMFFNAASNGLDSFYTAWRAKMRSACVGMTDSFTRGSVDGRPALEAKLSCPRNPETGKAENLDAILVQGNANMMMTQVAFRRPLTSADLALIQRVRGSLKVCDQRTLAECSARAASGFLKAN